MHRSGTSFLTGSLQTAGLYLGKHHTWNRHNHKGNRENDDIVQLNDRVLADNGGTWNAPPKQVVWQPSHYAAAAEIIRGYDAYTAWGFKDPRTLCTLDGWRHLIPGMKRVGIFRHPDAVIRSLNARGNMAVAEPDAIRLWTHYNQRLLAAYARDPFPILCFDWDPPVLLGHLDAVSKAFGLGTVFTDNPFFEPSLKHHDPDQCRRLPFQTRRLYAKLQQASNQSLTRYR
ncbi:MAG: sulfotransferase family protein [Deltaproteobacteria bacterium]|nr:MAG: sulfotransferase family protein [Deltaproteobacteria bacterium]